MNTTGEITLESPGDDVIEMDQMYFPNPWDLSQWLALNPGLNRLFTWRSKGELRGFALFGMAPHDDVAHLFKIVVSPQYRGSSTGKVFWPLLTAHLITMGINSVFLEVGVENSRAIRFYEKLGFKALRRVRGFYSDGGDAQTMALTLKVGVL